MNTIKRRVTFVLLVLAGIASIITAIAIPPLAAILGPLGGVLLAGAFGMFQSVITPSNDNEAQEPRPDNAEQTHAKDVHVDHNISLTDNSVNILFLYETHQTQNNLELEEPINIVRPHRPLNLV